MESRVHMTFNLIERDIFFPRLLTHKLHGKLSSTYACSIDRKYRLLFSFDAKYIYLESIGTHDELY